MSDRTSGLAKFDLRTADSRFQLTTSDGKTRLSGMLGALKLRVGFILYAFCPDVGRRAERERATLYAG